MKRISAVLGLSIGMVLAPLGVAAAPFAAAAPIGNNASSPQGPFSVSELGSHDIAYAPVNFRPCGVQARPGRVKVKPCFDRGPRVKPPKVKVKPPRIR